MSKSTKTVLIIAAAMAAVGLLLLVGVMAFSDGSFSFAKMFDSEKTEINREFVIESGDEIVINTDTEDVRLGVSPDEKAYVKYFDSKRITHEATQSEGRLEIINSYTLRRWYQFIPFSFGYGDSYIELLLPDNYSGDLGLVLTTGDVSIKNLSFEDMNVSLSTGTVSLEGITARNIEISSSTGDTRLENVVADNAVTVYCTTGRINAENATAKSFDFKATTGDISVNGIKSDSIRMKTTTGSMEFDELASDDISLKASTGSISGEIVYPISDFSITSDTNTGSNNLPQTMNGGDKKLSAETSTGSIDISFADN